MTTAGIGEAAAAAEGESSSLWKLAVKAYDQALEEFDEANEETVWAPAARLFKEWVQRDNTLFQELMANDVDAACWRMIKRVAHARRGGFRPPKVQERHDANLKQAEDAREIGMRAMAARTVRSFFDTFLLPGGMPLGSARRPDLLAAFDVWGGHAVANARQARLVWLAASLLPDDQKRVHEVLTEDQALKLHAQAIRTSQEIDALLRAPGEAVVPVAPAKKK